MVQHSSESTKNYSQDTVSKCLGSTRVFTRRFHRNVLCSLHEEDVSMSTCDNVLVWSVNRNKCTCSLTHFSKSESPISPVLENESAIVASLHSSPLGKRNLYLSLHTQHNVMPICLICQYFYIVVETI